MINHKMRTFIKGLKFTHLAILLGVIILFSHCEKDADEFGSDLIVNRDSVPLIADTLYNFNSYLEQSPSFPSNTKDMLIMGNTVNEYFGQLSSHSVCQFIVSTYVDSGTVYSSEEVEAEVILEFNEKYGDSEELKIDLFKVNKSLSPGELYYSDAKPEDYYSVSSLKISDSINYKGDSTYKIKLSNEFTQELNERTFQTVDDTLNFTEAIPGILFKANKVTDNNNLISVPIDECTVHLYYPKETDTATVTDTVDYRINADLSPRFNMFEHDYSKATSSPNANAALETEEADSLLFIQSLQGTHAKIKFTNISELQKRYEGKLIANASLIFDVREKYSPADSVQSNMTAYIYNDDSTYTRLNSYIQSMVNVEPQSYEGIYDKENNEMIFNINAYYQSLLNGRTDKNTIYLEPRLRRTKLNHIVLSGTKSNSSPRLEIQYYNTSK